MELNPASRYLEVVSDTWEDDPKLLERGMLRIPENVWFIGTANNDDSTFAISDKVYDRAMVMNLDRKADLFEPERVDGDRISFSRFTELTKEAKETYHMSEEAAEKVRKIDEFLTERFRVTRMRRNGGRGGRRHARKEGAPEARRFEPRADSLFQGCA